MKYRNKHTGLLGSQEHPFPIATYSDLAFFLPDLLFFFLMPRAPARDQATAPLVTLLHLVSLTGLPHSHHERGL